MKDLIELTPTESFLQNAGFKMTLKDVADQYGKENKNLVSDFNKMISTLDEERFNELKFQPVKYTDKKGELRPTIEQAVKIAKKPKVYENGYMSVRGCIGTTFEDIEDDVMETEVWDALVWSGLAQTKAKITVRREIPDELNGTVGKMIYNTPTYDSSLVRNAYDRWCKANKPQKSEVERLQEEFKQIASYYETKIEEAKNLLA